ncbi:hypothetical protein [Micromonospora sp. NPDC049891]|uniref:hypothetical protein n=1 Tax=Micromonospora sp. NPDC049891 TaxID=3155655 RepID=UPI0033F852A6
MRLVERRHEQLIYLFAATVLTVVTALAFWLGGLNLVGALTFSGQVTGVALLVAGAVTLAGAVSAGILAFARGSRQAGATRRRKDRLLLVILLALLAALLTNVMLLVTQLTTGDITWLLAGWVALCVLSVLLFGYVFFARGASFPLPRKIALGAAVTALLALANFAYSQLYLPSKQEAAIIAVPAFGTPTNDDDSAGVTVPFEVDFKVAGQPVYILAATYSVAGRMAAVTKAPAGGAEGDDDIARKWNSPTTRVDGYEPVDTGQLINPGSEYVANQEMKSVSFVRVPKPLRYDALMLRVDVVFIKADRARLGEGQSGGQEADYVWNIHEASELNHRVRRPVAVSSVWNYQPDAARFPVPTARYTYRDDDKILSDAAARRYGGWELSSQALLPLTKLS